MRKFLILFLAFSIAIPIIAHSGSGNESMKQWRVGYYQGGEYGDYYQNFLGILGGLRDAGLIQFDEFPKEITEPDMQGIWQWLCTSVKSDHLVFIPDAFWSADWNESERVKDRSKIIARLKKDDSDIDLMFAAGTWAGLDLVTDEHHTTTIVFSTSDPVLAGIIPSYDSNRFNHTFVISFPYRFETQLQVFHDIVGFKKLGIVYEDTQTGRSYAALETVHEMAKKYNFEVIEEHCLQDRPDADQTLKDLIECHKRLAPRVDAMYLTEYETMIPENMPVLLQPFFEYNIPTFSQSGVEDVPYGVLMSLDIEDPEVVGEFIAEKIAQILNGAIPGVLENRFHSPPRLSINIEVARLIGFNIPIVVMEMADSVINQIKKADTVEDKK